MYISNQIFVLHLIRGDSMLMLANNFKAGSALFKRTLEQRNKYLSHPSQHYQVKSSFDTFVDTHKKYKRI